MGIKNTAVTLMLLLITITALGCTESNDTIIGTWHGSDSKSPEFDYFATFYKDGFIVYSNADNMPFYVGTYRFSEPEENTIIENRGFGYFKTVYEFTNDVLKMKSDIDGETIEYSYTKVQRGPVTNSEKIVGSWTLSSSKLGNWTLSSSETEGDAEYYCTFYEDGICILKPFDLNIEPDGKFINNPVALKYELTDNSHLNLVAYVIDIDETYYQEFEIIELTTDKITVKIDGEITTFSKYIVEN